jgi:glycosyltransferase involved in cell wall biosynthesis
MDYPSLSILIPTYNNRVAMLRETLESVVRQSMTPRNLEVIVSNDNSTDETRAVLDEYKLRMPNLRVFHQEQRLGGPGNWDFLLTQATGEFVFLLCDDDALAPDFVASYLTLLRDDPELDMVLSDIELRDPEFSPIASISLHTPAGAADGQTRLRHQLMGHHMVMSTVYRRTLLLASGRWDEQVGMHLDCTAYCRAALRARRTWRIPQPFLRFRITSGSWSHKLATQNEGQMARWYRKKLDLIAEDAHRLAPELDDFIREMYEWHGRGRLAYLEMELAKGRLSGAYARSAVRAILQVFPELRLNRMIWQVLLVSVLGSGWLSGLRRLTGRPDPYADTLALFNSF